MRHAIISIVCALGAIGLLQQAAQAQARIAQFGAEHIIKADKTVIVTETIVLNIKGNAEHGLVRKFPTKMGVYGGKPAQYRVMMCFLDSKQFVAPSKSEGDSALVVLRTEAPLSPGLHTFVLQYEASGWVYPGARHDALWLNLIRDLGLPVDKAELFVRFAGFPGVAKIPRKYFVSQQGRIVDFSDYFSDQVLGSETVRIISTGALSDDIEIALAMRVPHGVLDRDKPPAS